MAKKYSGMIQSNQPPPFIMVLNSLPPNLLKTPLSGQRLSITEKATVKSLKEAQDWLLPEIHRAVWLPQLRLGDCHLKRQKHLPLPRLMFIWHQPIPEA